MTSFSSCDEITSLFPLELYGEVVALRASIDASKLKSGAFAIAGVAFGFDRAVKANVEWSRLMDGRTFHMTDFNARQGDFKGINDDDVLRIMHGIVDILRRHAAYMVSVSCDASLITEDLPSLTGRRGDKSAFLQRAFRSPYGVLCHLCMYCLGKLANQSRTKKRQISYVLEAGDEGQKGFVSYISDIQEDPAAGVMLDGYSLSQLTTANKDEMPGIFHSADFVAWEWARQINRQEANRPMRRSLAAVAGDYLPNDDYFGTTLSDQENMFFRNYDVRHMNRLAQFLRETIHAGKPADIEDAMSQWMRSR